MGFLQWFTVAWSVFFVGLCLLVYRDNPDTPRARWAVFGAVVAVEFALISATLQEFRVNNVQHDLIQAQSRLSQTTDRLAAAGRILSRETTVFASGHVSEYEISATAVDSMTELLSVGPDSLGMHYEGVEVRYDTVAADTVTEQRP